jgi:hypothetical protein
VGVAVVRLVKVRPIAAGTAVVAPANLFSERPASDGSDRGADADNNPRRDCHGATVTAAAAFRTAAQTAIRSSGVPVAAILSAHEYRCLLQLLADDGRLLMTWFAVVDVSKAAAASARAAAAEAQVRAGRKMHAARALPLMCVRVSRAPPSPALPPLLSLLSLPPLPPSLSLSPSSLAPPLASRLSASPVCACAPDPTRPRCAAAAADVVAVHPDRQPRGG